MDSQGFDLLIPGLMITKFLERLVDASSVPEVRHCFFDAMAEYGFENVLYAARFMLALPAAVFREDVESHSNFPSEFVRTLLSRDFLTTSPWARWALRNDGSIAARCLHERLSDAGGDETGAVALAEAHGVQAARVISLRDKVLRSHGAVVLNPFAGASHDEADHRWRLSSREVTALSWVMHMRMATIHRRSGPGRLTDRQRQVLEWSSAGKTVAEIATILGVTAATVEKHLRLARDTLAASSTAQAILKAHLTHQLFLHDPADEPFR